MRIPRFLKSHFELIMFFLIGSILFSGIIVGNAQVDTTYDILQREGEDISLRSYGKHIFIGTLVDSWLCGICGCENDKERVFIEGGSNQCVPPLDQYTASANSGRFPGGFAALQAVAMHNVVHDPMVPTNMALFMDDTFGDTIFGSPAYAQSNLSAPNDFFQSVTFELWKVSRNLSLGLLSVFVGIAALAVMFRSKLSPQATITISNVIPYIPVALAGIVLSYPIVTIAFNSLIPLMGLAFSLGGTVIASMTSATVNPVADLGVMQMISNVFTILLNPGTWILGMPAVSLALILMMLSFATLVIIGFFRYLYEAAKTVILFVIIVGVFPIVSAMAVLPNKQNLIVVLAKKTIVNLLTFPVMTLMVLIGVGFFLTMPSTAGSAFVTSDNFLTYLGAGIILPILKFSIGFGIIWQGFKVRNMLETGLGAQGSVFSLIQGGGGAPERGKR